VPSYSTAQEPVPEGKDLSAARLDTPAPETAAGKPEAAPVITGKVVDGPAKPRTPGKVTLYTVPPMGTLTVPADGDGDPVVIDQGGVEVDEVTAARAREAAAVSGLRLRED